MNDTPHAAIHCHGNSIPDYKGCGQVKLNHEQYIQQLSKPNQGWWCPNCGSTATFDDRYFEDLHYRLKEG